MTRREMLQWTSVIAASLLSNTGCGPEGNTVADSSTRVKAQPLASVPQQVASGGILDVQLTATLKTVTVGSDQAELRTFNGGIPGPVLRVNQGDRLRIRVDNRLPPNVDPAPLGTVNEIHNLNSTNLHTHGLHVSPNSPSDNIFVTIDPGTSFQYEYQIPVDHPDGSFWYHPHFHGSTAEQVKSGMAGPLIISGPTDRVPEIAAAKEVILFIQEFNFLPGDPDQPGGPQPTYAVNGQLVPVLTIRSGEVQRWRVFNATWESFIPFALDDHILHQIANDGISFPRPVATSSVFLSPSNRADILVQGGAPGLYAVRKQRYFQELDRARPESTLLLLRVTAADGPPMALPQSLPAPPILTSASVSQPTVFRTIEFVEGVDGFDFAIIGRPGDPATQFDEQRVDQSVALNAVEEWTLLNSTPNDHPFHIHVNPFLIMELNGTLLSSPVWADTVIIPKQVNGVKGSVRVRTRFSDFAGKFVYHCHILDHNDLGMMHVVQVS